MATSEDGALGEAGPFSPSAAGASPAAAGAGGGGTPDDDEESSRIAMEIDLVHAARDGNLAEVRRLIEDCRVAVDAVDTEGSTALMAVCFGAPTNAAEIVNYLLSRGANINAVQDEVGVPRPMCRSFPLRRSCVL